MDKRQQSLSRNMYQELGELREEIRKFADTLQLFEHGTEPPSAEETIEMLRGISVGAFSCAELLSITLTKSGQGYRAFSAQKKTYQDQVSEKVDETLRRCADLSTSVRSLKQLLRSMPNIEMTGMEQASQRVQAALSNIAEEWEDL